MVILSATVSWLLISARFWVLIVIGAGGSVVDVPGLGFGYLLPCFKCRIDVISWSVGSEVSSGTHWEGIVVSVSV